MVSTQDSGTLALAAELQAHRSCCTASTRVHKALYPAGIEHDADLASLQVHKLSAFL